MEIESATNINAEALEPDATGVVQSSNEKEQALQPDAVAPGAALSALSSSPAAITATIDRSTTVSAEQVERIDNAIQQLESNPDQLLTLLSQSVAMTERLKL